MKDESVSVNCYQQDREGREEHTSCLDAAHHLADKLLEELKLVHIDCHILCTMSGPKTQKFILMSARVTGMVKVQRRRSDKARLAMKIFLVVKRT